MAKQTTVKLIDDTDRSDATQTISFALEGVNYEIDLNDENANRMREGLAYWVNHARRAGGRRRASSPRLNAAENQKIRDWAKANGIQVADRGRIPADVVAKYRSATQG